MEILKRESSEKKYNIKVGVSENRKEWEKREREEILRKNII